MNSGKPIADPTRGTTPQVCVVIPARNAAHTLQQTLRSVQAQDFGDWELVVVDDGSSDETGALARRHAQADARIRVVAGPCRGVSAARNAGIRAARAELVAFLDADDLWLPAKLRAHVEQMTRMPHLGLSFDRIRFVDAQARPTAVLSTRRVSGLAPHEFLFENPACTASTLVARREALLQIGGFDEGMRFAEDLELLLRLRCTTAWGVDGLPQVLTHYRASPQGASSDLDAMQGGWETLMQRVARYAPALVRQHIDQARAVHLRYLARRALRLRLPPHVGLRLLRRAVHSSPAALLRAPRRTLGTLCGLLLHSITHPLLRRARS